MRKNLKKIFLLITIMTAMYISAGCVAVRQNDSALPPGQGNMSAQQSTDTSDAHNEAPINGEKQENDTKEKQEEAEQPQPEEKPDQPEGDLTETPANEASETTSDESVDLYVHVESIGDNSVMGSKISVEPIADSNSEIMVIAGGEDKMLITVHFKDDTSYIYQIIRNGGADVETSEGSFSDIGLSMILDLTGHYEGDDFYADKVVISDVRID